MDFRLNNLENNNKSGSRRSEIKYDITNFSEEFFISKFKLVQKNNLYMNCHLDLFYLKHL